MAAPNKSSSRWGSFLSQAVAGVESRLDNILADVDESAAPAPAAAKPKPPSQQQPSGGAANAVPPGVRPSPAASRSSSNTRTNDRLQARLAKAMAGKQAPGSNASPRSSVDNSTRPSMELPAADNEAPAAETADTPATELTEEKKDEESSKDDAAADPKPAAAADSVPVDETTEKIEPTEPTEPTEPATPAEPAEQTNDAHPEGMTNASKEDVVSLVREVEEVKSRQQEEIQEYIERIDSLQSKLQYLSKSAAETAKKTAASSPSGSTERKIAERDEKIALLMEEGQKLATGEQKYRGIIKKLRQQVADNEKQTEELKRSKEKAVSDAAALRNQLNGSEEKEKRQEEARRATAGLQKEIDSLKKERTMRDETIKKLERDLKSKTEEASHASTLSKNLSAEKEKLKTQEEKYSTLVTEKETLSEKARQDGIEWGEKLDRAVERGRATEAELKVELKAMETKLEAMRSQAEEVTSGSGGEAQVKLLRQIETLQSQYASASDNWQGIEASLLTKVSNLEKERDEAQKRESEMRKKARDATTRARNVEEELEDAQPALAKAQKELEKAREEVATLKASLKKAEEDLEQAQSDLAKEQKTRSTASLAEVDGHQEQQNWTDDASIHVKDESRPESPMRSVSRTFSSDLSGLGLSLPTRAKSPMSMNLPESPGDMYTRGRRPSAQLLARPTAGSQAGSGPPAPYSPFQPSEAEHVMSPSITERENGLDEATPSSPHQTAQDMISMSTVAAGPSVQLVERMSAAIRRLEREKVAAKEEMSRVCSQRDEARSDMVSLMKELEEAKTASSRVPQLEEDVASLDSRYQTTLEMLGEKSELVEELRADVQDIKAMYRELVEQTIK